MQHTIKRTLFFIKARCIRKGRKETQTPNYTKLNSVLYVIYQSKPLLKQHLPILNNFYSIVFKYFSPLPLSTRQTAAIVFDKRNVAVLFLLRNNFRPTTK